MRPDARPDQAVRRRATRRVTFINVEPYKLKLVDGALQADLDANGQLQTVAVDRRVAPAQRADRSTSSTATGIVTANFELIFSDAELTAALDAVK